MKRTIPDSSRWLRIVPELTFFHDPADRAAAWQTAFKTFRWRYLLLAFLVATIVLALNRPLANFFMGHLRAILGAPRLRSIPEAAVHCAFSAMLGVLGGGSLVWLFRHRIQRSLRQQLVARGIPICIACGYDLRGQVEPRCPECGTPFDSSLIRNPALTAAGLPTDPADQQPGASQPSRPPDTPS